MIEPKNGSKRAELEDTGEGADRIFVVVNGSDAAIAAVQLGRQLADAYQVCWEAIVPETASSLDEENLAKVGETLALAAQLGAAVFRLPAATVADAIEQHVKTCRKPHVVLIQEPRKLYQRVRCRSVLEQLTTSEAGIICHVVGENSKTSVRTAATRVPFEQYVIATAMSLFALAIVFSLRAITGTDYLSVLLIIPVIAAAASLGLRPGLLAAAISSLGFNYLFLEPLRVLDPSKAQTWLMFAALAAVATYTSKLAGTIDGRLALSDRSARESAALAAFAQELTRVADWTSTGKVVCREIRDMLQVRASLFREVNGQLCLVASDPEGANLDPLDKTAMEWAWQHKAPTGSGTTLLGDASWQFHPLSTSLGVLAVLGLAREDGRDPIPAERQVLLGTLVSQAALAHERLRLEDRDRNSSHYQ